jgi:hypothetical protein
MRTTALISLLPLLATLPSTLARPHHHHDKSVKTHHRVRKSLAFGPAHPHASFEVLEEPMAVLSFDQHGEVDVKEIAKVFIEGKLQGDGVGFYLRDDVSRLAWEGYQMLIY